MALTFAFLLLRVQLWDNPVYSASQSCRQSVADSGSLLPNHYLSDALDAAEEQHAAFVQQQPPHSSQYSPAHPPGLTPGLPQGYFTAAGEQLTFEQQAAEHQPPHSSRYSSACSPPLADRVSSRASFLPAMASLMDEAWQQDLPALPLHPPTGPALTPGSTSLASYARAAKSSSDPAQQLSSATTRAGRTRPVQPHPAQSRASAYTTPRVSLPSSVPPAEMHQWEPRISLGSMLKLGPAEQQEWGLGAQLDEQFECLGEGVEGAEDEEGAGLGMEEHASLLQLAEQEHIELMHMLARQEQQQAQLLAQQEKQLAWADRANQQQAQLLAQKERALVDRAQRLAQQQQELAWTARAHQQQALLLAQQQQEQALANRAQFLAQQEQELACAEQEQAQMLAEQGLVLADRAQQQRKASRNSRTNSSRVPQTNTNSQASTARSAEGPLTPPEPRQSSLARSAAEGSLSPPKSRLTSAARSAAGGPLSTPEPRASRSSSLAQSASSARQALHSIQQMQRASGRSGSLRGSQEEPVATQWEVR